MDQKSVEAKAEMLIRKPVAEVFAAFINPEITTKFWFTKSSGKLETGKQVQWDWEMYGASSQVTVKAIEQNKRILIEWSGYGSPTPVEWIFMSVKTELLLSVSRIRASQAAKMRSCSRLSVQRQASRWSLRG